MSRENGFNNRITYDQLAQIEVLERNAIALTHNAEDFFFLIEANRIRLAYQFDPQLAVSVSQVDPYSTRARPSIATHPSRAGFAP